MGATIVVDAFWGDSGKGEERSDDVLENHYVAFREGTLLQQDQEAHFSELVSAQV